MKRILTTLGILAVAAGLFAGDAAAFVDFGFSADGKTYIFGQYGKTDKDFKGYAEIYTVDIKKNDFVVNGVFKTTDKTGKSGSEVFSQLKNKHKSFLDKYKLCPVEADSLLYVRDEPTKSGSSEIRFKDFESSTPAEDVYFTVKLVPMYEGRGTSTQSSFYIVTEKQEEVRTFLLSIADGGVTLINARGGFSNHKETLLLGVVPTRQYFIVKEGLKQIDKNIFFLSCDAYEVSSRKK